MSFASYWCFFFWRVLQDGVIWSCKVFVECTARNIACDYEEQGGNNGFRIEHRVCKRRRHCERRSVSARCPSLLWPTANHNCWDGPFATPNMAENIAGASATRTPIPFASTHVLLDVSNVGYCYTRSSTCMDTHSVSNLSSLCST